MKLVFCLSSSLGAFCYKQQRMKALYTLCKCCFIVISQLYAVRVLDLVAKCYINI